MKLKHPKLQITRKWITLAAVAASACGAMAQSADAIIGKLVEKGILTSKEADDLRKEANNDFTKAYSSKSGMPDWISSLKMSGDFRARYDSVFSDAKPEGAANSFEARDRYRFRLRLGITATMYDNFEFGARLMTGEAQSGFTTGSPLSGNVTAQDNASKKGVFIDLAYGRWYALKRPDWTATLTVGKMENPYTFDELILDPDYTPEGAALQLGYKLSDQHALKLNAGGFILDESAASSHDANLLAAQVRWDATWNKEWSSTLGAAFLTVNDAPTLLNAAVPNVNRGNTRNADTSLTYGFNPWLVDGGVTYTLASFPFYKGAFPIRVSGEYMQNPAAPSSADNDAWNAGIMFGKSGKKGTWDVSYNYRWLGANSWYEELVDDDFGAFYGGANSPANSGFNAGYGSGTNVKGHVIRVQYSPTASVTLALKYFLTDIINPVPAGSKSEMNRFFVDASLKF